jgi:hypothetical protein
VKHRTAAAAVILLTACAGPRAEPPAADQAPPAQSGAPATPAVAAAAPAGTPTVVVYKSPSCGCCTAWVDRMREAGFTVDVRDMEDVGPEKQRAGVPLHLASCHTARVGDYALEGHVPPDAVLRLLRERPAVAGLAVPGMPAGSPGMEMGTQKDPYDVVAWTREGETRVYESR